MEHILSWEGCFSGRYIHMYVTCACMTVAYCTQNSSSACFHASSVLPPTPNQKFCNAHTARSEFDHINKTVTRVFSYTNMYMSLYIQRLQTTCMYIHIISFPWKLMKGCWGAAILWTKIRGASRRERERERERERVPNMEHYKVHNNSDLVLMIPSTSAIRKWVNL